MRRIIIFLLLITLTGCSFFHKIFGKKKAPSDFALYERGMVAFDQKKYSKAIKYLKKLKESYPFSPYTLDGILKLAEAYYLKGDLEEAEATYKEFESLHPGDKRIPFVLYKIGVINFQEFKSIDLPKDDLIEAIKYFNKLIELYPNSKYTKKAKEYIRKCRRLQAYHEIFIADFYWRTKRYLGAWKEYSLIVEKFKEFPDICSYASRMKKLSYYKYQEQKSKKELDKYTRSWKDLFKWL